MDIRLMDTRLVQIPSKAAERFETMDRHYKYGTKPLPAMSKETNPLILSPSKDESLSGLESPMATLFKPHIGRVAARR